jgi:poly-gamma-glutamate capsule biosynthesis protein CapA/YwtB (metallophosphatase superfamily)
VKIPPSGDRLGGCTLPFQPVLLLAVFLLGMAACRPPRSATLALLGDINLGRGVIPSGDSFAPLAGSLYTADLALANLESPLGGEVDADSTSYNLCAPAERAFLLASWGIDLLSLVNNHADDCAPDGLNATHLALAAAGLTGLTPQPLRLEINGLRLAFFAFDDVSAMLDADEAAEAIHLAKADGALVIVSLHWGMEYQGMPTPRQEAMAAQFAEAGAVLIWGHHPHVLQPAEWIETTRGRTLVLYSLGNTLFDQGGLDDTRQSALVLITLDEDGVKAVQAVPFLIDVPHSRILEPDADTAEELLERIRLK